jgi:hypothetical protein
MSLNAINLFTGIRKRVLTLDAGEDYLLAICEIVCLANVILA